MIEISISSLFIYSIHIYSQTLISLLKDVRISGPSLPTTTVSSTLTPNFPVYSPQFPTARITLAGSGGASFSPWKNA